MRTLAEKFELATENIRYNLSKFGYTVESTIWHGLPIFKVVETPNNYPNLKIDTIPVDNIYYFEATLTFTKVVLKSEFADDIEADLKKFTELGKVLTSLNRIYFDPMEWEDDCEEED